MSDASWKPGGAEAHAGRLIQSPVERLLRARVTELEGEVEAARTTAIREAVERLSDEVIARELSPSVDPYGNIVWWFDDAASFRTALLAALLPAPAPGRDLVSEANVTSNASIAAGGK